MELTGGKQTGAKLQNSNDIEIKNGNGGQCDQEITANVSNFRNSSSTTSMKKSVSNNA